MATTSHLIGVAEYKKRINTLWDGYVHWTECKEGPPPIVAVPDLLMCDPTEKSSGGSTAFKKRFHWEAKSKVFRDQETDLVWFVEPHSHALVWSYHSNSEPHLIKFHPTYTLNQQAEFRDEIRKGRAKDETPAPKEEPKMEKIIVGLYIKEHNPNWDGVLHYKNPNQVVRIPYNLYCNNSAGPNAAAAFEERFRWDGESQFEDLNSHDYWDVEPKSRALYKPAAGNRYRNEFHPLYSLEQLGKIQSLMDEGLVNIRYGVYNKNGNFAGKTIAEVRKLYKDIWGLRDEAGAYIGTRPLAEHYIIQPKDLIEFWVPPASWEAPKPMIQEQYVIDSRPYKLTWPTAPKELVFVLWMVAAINRKTGDIVLQPTTVSAKTQATARLIAARKLPADLADADLENIDITVKEF